MDKLKTAESERKILASNLTKLLSLSNKTKADVARDFKKYEVSETTVYSWFNAKKYPRIDKIQLLADYFGVLKSEITDDKNQAKKQQLSEAQYLNLPFYESVSAGAFAEIDGKTDNNIEYVKIPKQFLGKYSTDKGLFVMRVNGDSMNKIIPNGSYIIAKKQETTEFKDRDIVVFSHDNGYSLKRFLPHDVSNAILFKAETNDTRIKDIVIPHETCNDLKIHAKVVWYSITLD
ncbi:MAG: family transcriptional regulator [Sporolactobacillus laevolacticus]|nr:family transcriptional regulator [Sporolactobacillus laevolacticus]